MISVLGSDLVCSAGKTRSCDSLCSAIQSLLNLLQLQSGRLNLTPSCWMLLLPLCLTVVLMQTQGIPSLFELLNRRAEPLQTHTSFPLCSCTLNSHFLRFMRRFQLISLFSLTLNLLTFQEADCPKALIPRNEILMNNQNC